MHRPTQSSSSAANRRAVACSRVAACSRPAASALPNLEGVGASSAAKSKAVLRARCREAGGEESTAEVERRACGVVTSTAAAAAEASPALAAGAS